MHLLLADERAPQHADALADHANVETVLLLEVVDDLLKCWVVVEREAVPQRPLSCAVLLLLRGNGLREADERQRKVDETVLEVVQLCLAVDELVQFEADETRHERRGRGDGWDNLPGNLLGRVPVGGVDAVVHGPQVRASRDEINVVVRVVVLLKVDGVETVASQRRRSRELLGQLHRVGICGPRLASYTSQYQIQRTIAAATAALNWLILGNLNLHSALRCELGDHNALRHLLVVADVWVALEPVVEGMEVRSRNNVRKVSGLITEKLVSG
jgi:hypothetical protein